MSDPKDQPKVRPLSPPVRLPSGNYRFSPGMLTPDSFKVGAQGVLPPHKVIPIVFIPGIMGSNVRVRPQAEAKVRQYFRDEAREKDYTDQAWRAPNPDGTILKEVVYCDSNITKSGKLWGSFSPRLRQAMLNPDTTEVDHRGKVNAPDWLSGPDGKTTGALEAYRRGWGSVHYFSYGDFLNFLEKNLNWMQHLAPKHFLEKIQKMSKKDYIHASLKANDDDIKKMFNYQFPVYAAGYNWVQCNKVSAEKILAWIKGIIASYQAAKLDCKQVIIITHSMGGLVGRMLSKLDTEGLVLGILHGAMPAVGAPLAYRRAVAGVENPETYGASGSVLPEAIVETFQRLAGRDARESMPVMANSPGSLELLPNQLHEPGWLKIDCVVDQTTQMCLPEGMNEHHLGRPLKTQVKTIAALPSKDPYEEIYTQKDRWYRLMDPAYIDPLKAGKKADESWERYLKNINKAKTFHQELGSYYHPEDEKRAGTYIFYGSDPKHQSFGSVRWRLACEYNEELPSHTASGEPNVLVPFHPPSLDQVLQAKIPGQTNPDVPIPEDVRRRRLCVISQASQGQMYSYVTSATSPVSNAPNKDYPLAFCIQGTDSDGDGTVSHHSGAAPGTSRAGGQSRIYKLKGFDHQGAYAKELPRLITLLAICQIVRKAK